MARDLENALQVYEASGKSAVIGVMTSHFEEVNECISYVRRLKEFMPAVSVGLGDGDPTQWRRVVRVACATDPGHVNQVYPASGYTVGALNQLGLEHNVVNALIRPSGTPGKVVISTGPRSGSGAEVVVDARGAAAMLADVGVMSIKFYPIDGETRLNEVAAMAEAAADAGIPIFEPTGGLDEGNVASVVTAVLKAGVTWVIPHLYSSMIDNASGLTCIDKVTKVMEALDQAIP